MRRLNLLLPLVLAISIASNQVFAQVTSNVFERVLLVRTGAGTQNEGTATAFTIEVDGRQYLLTAKHVVSGMKDDDFLEIYKSEKWTSIKVKIFRCDDPIDIAVLVPPEQLTPSYPMEYDQMRVMFGQDGYFLGFPYGQWMSGKNVNGEYPLAFTKRATISATEKIDTEKKAIKILLDGHNNPGFSGGPIVYRDLNQPGSVTYKLLAVVSGFKPEFLPVLDPKPLDDPTKLSDTAKLQPWRVVQKKDGKWYELVDSDHYVASNTGIIEGYIVAPAIDLIRKHPIGPAVAPQN